MKKRVGVKVNNEARMEKRGKKDKLVTTFLEPKSLNVDLFTTSIVSHLTIRFYRRRKNLAYEIGILQVDSSFKHGGSSSNG